MTPDDTTVRLVPLSELVDLARLVGRMRQAQRAYFEAKRRQPHVQPTAIYEEARALERRVDAAVREAIARGQLPLPGMEGGDDRKS